MAYATQDHKAHIARELKKVVPKGWKYSLSVRNHMSVVCTIASAPIDLIAQMQQSNNRRAERTGMPVCTINGHAQINIHHYEDVFDANAQPVIDAIIKAMKSADWYDKSNIQSDYFDTAYYIDLNVGRWDKPFEVKK